MNESRRTVYCVFERANHVPLALRTLTSFAKAYRNGQLQDHYDFKPNFYSNAKTLLLEMKNSEPGIVLFSHYVWNTKILLAISRALKHEFPECITVHGGPSVPKYDYACEEFMALHDHVDVAVRGEGELTLSQLLEKLAERPRRHEWGDAFASVDGITFCPGEHDRERVLRTAERQPVKDLDSIPSPYLTGDFGSRGEDHWIAGIVETNRGCPYGCAFCDWGSATLQKVRKFSMDRVRAEIEWIAKAGLEVLWLADANFGVVPRDVEVAELIARAKQEHGYPKQVVVNYAKNATPRLAEIVKVFSQAELSAEGIIALQTNDPDTLNTIRRHNIKSERYYELLEIFKREKMPVSTDLLIGLPGATADSFMADLQFCFDRRVHPKAYAVSVLPNAPMAHRDYMARHEIKVDENDFVISTKTASAEDIKRMHQLYETYLIFVEFALLRYVLYFVQREYGIRAVDVLSQLFTDLEAKTQGLETLRRARASLGQQSSTWTGRIWYRPSAVFIKWDRFYREVADYLHDRFGVERNSALDTVLETQEALMPRFGKAHPKTVELAHDMVAYLHDAQDERRLAEFPPRSIEISDPLKMCWLPLLSPDAYGHHKVHFELHSPLMFDLSADRFLFVPKKRNPVSTTLRVFPMVARLVVNGLRSARDFRQNVALGG